jgi:hypothetical protein
MDTRRHYTRRGPRLGLLAPLIGAVLLLGAACDAGSTGLNPGRTNSDPYGSAIPHQPYGGGYLGGHASGDTEAGAAFARWVLEQDPQRQYLTDAVVRDEQTLGVKVQPTITKGDLQQLMTALAEGMARTFPGKPVNVIAYYQSGDKLAEAQFDPRTQQVSMR